MKVNSCTSPVFHGFNNVLVNDILADDNTRLTLLALQLNNNDGENDLDKLREIRKIGYNNMPKADYSKDIVMFTRVQAPDWEKIMIDSSFMFTGDELKALEKQTDPEFAHAKNLSIKFYSLIGSLTRRMANMVHFPTDSNYYNVVMHIDHALTQMVKSPKLGYVMTQSSINNYNFQDIAKFINKCVTDTMMKFFR